MNRQKAYSCKAGIGQSFLFSIYIDWYTWRLTSELFLIMLELTEVDSGRTKMSE